MPAQSSSYCRSCQSANQSTFDGEIAIHFPGLEGLRRTHSLGFSKASGLFELWLHGTCNSRSRVTTASGKQSGWSLTCRAEDWPFILGQGRYASSASLELPD